MLPIPFCWRQLGTLLYISALSSLHSSFSLLGENCCSDDSKFSMPDSPVHGYSAITNAGSLRPGETTAFSGGDLRNAVSSRSLWAQSTLRLKVFIQCFQSTETTPAFKHRYRHTYPPMWSQLHSPFFPCHSGQGCAHTLLSPCLFPCAFPQMSQALILGSLSPGESILKKTWKIIREWSNNWMYTWTSTVPKD